MLYAMYDYMYVLYVRLQMYVLCAYVLCTSADASCIPMYYVA